MIDADDLLVGDLMYFKDRKFLAGNTHFHEIAMMGGAGQQLETERFEETNVFIQVAHDQFNMVDAANHFLSSSMESLDRT